MLKSCRLHFLLICIIALFYLTLHDHPQLQIARFLKCRTIVLVGSLRVKGNTNKCGLIALAKPVLATLRLNYI